MVVGCKNSKSSSTQLEGHFNCIILHAAHLTVHEHCVESLLMYCVTQHNAQYNIQKQARNTLIRDAGFIGEVLLLMRGIQHIWT